MSRILLLALALVLGAAGCNTGDVQVSGQAPGTIPASTNAQNPPSAQSAPGTSSSGTSGSSTASSKVYFERVLMDGGSPDQIVAISFASQDSTTITPFGVPLKSSLNFSAHPIFFPFQDQVTYLSSDGLSSSGVGNDSLASTALGTMQTQSLFDFPAEVSALAVDAGQTVVAWIDPSGNASVSSLSTGTTQPLSISPLAGSNDAATSLQLAGSNLLALTAGGQAVVFPLNGAEKPQLEVSGITAAALSPDGSRLAYVKSDGTLYVLNSSNGEEIAPVLTLESGAVTDFSWPSADRLSYWVRLSSGAAEIHVVDLSIPQELSVAQLSVPTSVTGGIVCPAWSGDTLYFGNVVGGEFVIERASAERASADDAKSAKLAQPQVFAMPPASDEGFVCPKVAQEGGSK